MKLIEHQYCFLAGDLLLSDIVVGFTKPELSGKLPQDIHTALSFLEKKLEVSYMNQLHSAKLHIIDKPHVYDGDALFTKKKNHVLVVKTADCLPLFFHSADQGVVGALHMGWRSANAGILEKIPFNLSSFIVVAGIGLRYCCYEVGKEFLEYPRLKSYVSQKETKFYFNPIEFAKDTLVSKGLDENNFFDLGFCNSCMGQNFFSYRKSATKNRTFSFILQS